MQVFAHAFERVHHRDAVALQLQTGSVTEVAMGHGFWHLGRFAGLYKNYYGESPSETVRAMG